MGVARAGALARSGARDASRIDGAEALARARARQVIGYSIGLMMANVAVYVMDMGQPALLYLVPCTLGVFCAVAHREGKFQMMWAGPPSLNGGVPGGQEMYPCAAGDDGEAVYEPGGAGFHPTKDIESHRLLG